MPYAPAAEDITGTYVQLDSAGQPVRFIILQEPSRLGDSVFFEASLETDDEDIDFGSFEFDGETLTLRYNSGDEAEYAYDQEDEAFVSDSLEFVKLPDDVSFDAFDAQG